MTKSYRSHKIVTACAILAIGALYAETITENTGEKSVIGTVYTLDDGAELKLVTGDPMLSRYQPVVGDYVVTYPLKDGETEPYRSFSPKAAFEDGYTELAETAAAQEPGGALDPSNPNRDPQTVVMSSLDNIAGSLGRIADIQAEALDFARR